MPRKTDPLIRLFELYQKHGLSAVEMAHHMRTELKLNPDMLNLKVNVLPPLEKGR